MASSVSIGQRRSSAEEEEARPATEVGALLRLLGAGASGSILLALGDGALRTRELTTRVPGYAPRTVYRYVGRLADIGAIEREEEPGVPSKVLHRLFDPRGVDFHDLVRSYSEASISLERLSDGGIVPHSWGSLTLLADLWESGMFAAMNTGACTATELARVGHDFSFHQVSRRTSLFMIGGMIREGQNGDRRRRYELTDAARQATALIAGLGQWRERYVVEPGMAGLTLRETRELLRAALPLVRLPNHASKSICLSIVPRASDNGDEGEVIRAEVQADGALVVSEQSESNADGWGRGSVGEWIQTLLGGSRVRIGGSDKDFVRACLDNVATSLWPQQPSVASAIGRS
jgi:DNA-binding HxlR family transcriptional regulator